MVSLARWRAPGVCFLVSFLGLPLGNPHTPVSGSFSAPAADWTPRDSRPVVDRTRSQTHASCRIRRRSPFLPGFPFPSTERRAGSTTLFRASRETHPARVTAPDHLLRTACGARASSPIRRLARSQIPVGCPSPSSPCASAPGRRLGLLFHGPPRGPIRRIPVLPLRSRSRQHRTGRAARPVLAFLFPVSVRRADVPPPPRFRPEAT